MIGFTCHAHRVATRTLALTLAMTGACVLQDAQRPPLSGPSELGTSLALSASPDVLLQDGRSQSQVLVAARDANGRPLRDLSVRAEILLHGTPVDFGRLSGRTAVTGSDGKATFFYTAPAAPAEPVDQRTIVAIRVTPLGTNHASAVPRYVEIRLVPPGIILPPNGIPVPAFTYSPRTVEELTSVFFDASGSRDDGSIVSYQWDFGDGVTAGGIRISHAYVLRGTYHVTLTVTDDRGLRASTSQPIVVAATPPPAASFTTSPASPAVHAAVFFNASASGAAPGRQIVSYAWTFGDGGTGAGSSTSHRYSAPGTYNVVLTVRDNAGKTGTAVQAITVRP